MPLAGSGLILGAALASSGGIVDPKGILAAGGLAEALVDWLVANAIVKNIPLIDTMVAAGSAVAGFGSLSFSADGDELGNALADSVAFPVEGNHDRWEAFGRALVGHLEEKGRVNPTLFVASPSGGAVTGTGLVSFATTTFDPPLADVLVAPGSVNATIWAAVGTTILTHISTNALVASLGFTSPPGGGPLVGVSKIG